MTQFMFNLMKAAVDPAVKALVFAVPVAFVAQWCDVAPTWKMAAFVAFCITWSGCLDSRSSSSTDDPPADANRKPAPVILTPAQVAAEAQKLTPRPLRSA